ncbi:HlyD family secretion protein [Stenotrophomonas maltophilia]|uniref:HlyD family secretion protein n=1 Tax=Stenotrophomonas maltophilia TaxID=40324 RepID=UPI002A98235E|nr:HlyD family efflux transporter periplasmic adaptor subunit [Stenotrophomonas maltophilia]HEL3760528.1 HlyD family efflux transporter periplasmic adaptor subunit [Stenotrophomonas maltophilia]HEL5337220.1 HlyD family efflux transporter periplasmic adaptor subunit [Stenotrophomonas maltophilia]
MTKTSHLLPLSLALSAALLLGACSRDAPAPAQSPSGKAGATAVGKVAVARGIIDVEGGLIALAPPVDGSITAAPVKEGATVKKGQLLLSLDGALLQQEVAMASADLALANDRLKGSQAQLRELERNATRLSKGASEGVSSNQQADAAKQQLAGVRADVDVASAQVDLAQHKLEHARLKLQQMSLSAPEAGTVVGQVPGLGAFVQAGKPAISLLPARPLQVRAELSAAYADAVQVGMKATVVPDSDGAENTSTLPSARVVRISPVFAQARLPEDAGRGVAKVVECVLEFDGEAKARFGQHVRVEFRK